MASSAKFVALYYFGRKSGSLLEAMFGYRDSSTQGGQKPILQHLFKERIT